MSPSLLPTSHYSSSLVLVPSLRTLENQLCKVPICGRIVTAFQYSGFPTVSFHFPFSQCSSFSLSLCCTFLRLVAKFFLQIATRNSAHSFPSPARAFYFLPPLLMLSYHILPSSLVHSFSFNIPNFTSFLLSESSQYTDTHTHTHTLRKQCKKTVCSIHSSKSYI